MLNTASVTIILRLALLAASRPFQRRHVVVRVALGLGALRLGQLHGVDQRGVVELVGEHRIAAPGQGWRDGEVGEIAGGKSQGARKPVKAAISFPAPRAAPDGR
jgi:hypothetical protein